MKTPIKSMPSAYSHIGKTSAEVQVNFSVSNPKFATPVTIPKDTLCHKVGNRWLVADLGFIENKQSILYDDADHYGIPVPDENITDIQEMSEAFQEETDRRQRQAMRG